MKFKLQSRLALQVFFVFSLLLSSITVIIPQPVQATADWYDTDWGYRKEITINGSSAGAQTNYQMKLTVNKGTGTDSGSTVYLANHAANWPNDIRFTKSDGTTLLDYWVESSDSNTAVVWIEFDSIPTSGSSANFYIYYGNSGASSGSNGDNTFSFFDHFLGSAYDTNKWQQIGNPSSIAVSNSELTITKTSLTSVATHGIVTKTFTIDELRVLAKAKTNASYANVCQSPFMQRTSENAKQHVCFYENNDIILEGDMRGESGGLTTATVNSNYSANTYYILEMTRWGSSKVSAYENHVYKCEVTTNIKDAAAPIVTGIIEWGSHSSVSLTVDWIAVAKYVSPEPTWGTWGSEETPSAAPTVTTNDASQVEETTARTGGSITSLNNGGNATVRGVQYDTDSGTPYSYSSYTTGSYGTGSFDIDLTSLTQGELYYFRAYATNSAGTGYGAEKTFLTKPNEPTNFTATPGDTKVNLSWSKGSGAQKTMIRYRTDGSYPTSYTDGTQAYFDSGTSYEHTGLTNGVTYKYRGWSYATEGGLTQYSDAYIEVSATPGGAPIVTTGICSGSGTTWAVLNGNITDAGLLGNVTQRGFEYGLTTSYGTNVLTSGIYGTGGYVASLTGLSPSTIYHYRAKAYNGAWGYGADAIFATKGSPAITTYFNTGDDAQTDIYGVNVAGQTFTTSSTTQYTVTSVRLKVLRVGNPGNITVSIRRATAGANNTPTGVDIASKTINGNSLGTSAEWYDFAMNTEVPLELNAPYAIVVSAASGDSNNYIRWRRVDAGGLSGGNAVTSANSGTSWTAQTYDHLFELWGNQSLEIQDVKVFHHYKEPGDWLITIRYVNMYAPYYDSYDVRKYFALQLVDSDDNVRASTVIPAWGNKVGNIYISANSASALTPGGNYRVRIYGTFTGNPYTEYALTSSDWLGDDLQQLDSWVITSASVIGNYYGQILTVDIPGRGEVLNAAGGTIFTAGINGLPTVRPEIYQISTSPIGYTPESTAQTYRQSFNWQAAWGPEGTVMITRIANVFGVDGGFIGGMFFIIMLFALALLAFPAGHTTAANILSIPCLGLAVFFGLDIIYIVILALFAAFLLFKNQFMDK